MKKNLIFITCLLISLQSNFFYANDQLYPFENKYYKYTDDEGTVESFRFFGKYLEFHSFGKTKKIKYSYDKKTKVISISTYSKGNIAYTDQYLYNPKADSFTLIEKPQLNNEWILKYSNDISKDDIEVYKLFELIDNREQ